MRNVRIGERNWVRASGSSLVSVVLLAGNQGPLATDLQKQVRQSPRKFVSVFVAIVTQLVTR